VRIRKTVAAAAIAGGVLVSGVITAAPASAQQVGCASYDFALWGAGGVPVCFAGTGVTQVKVYGVTGANLRTANCFQFDISGEGWTGCLYGPDWTPSHAVTIIAESEN
jgi:hypothetical protein